ncbi:MAG: hypothetical protein J5710_04070 [Treponema sp.]|nr:hypothetical protein [Treponema sp.]
MKKNPTTFMILAFIAAISLLAGCNGSPNGNTAYDSTYYNVSMRDALQASQAFVKESVKKSASRSAFVDLEEEDTWQGYIGTNWNVPSSIYGTSLTTADNELVINGENLGTLQELVFHKDEEGHFTKAVFEYKGNLYYVMDDQDGRFVVLSSEDDYDHIFFTQDGKAFTKDWSNFKIWTWVKAGDGKLYRNGNLGYAYTLRNVQMLDGSYATVTVSGFNYYNYGFRVWIEETDGKTVKKDYPSKSADNTNSYTYQPKTDMDKYLSETAENKLVFEYTNKTGKADRIYNFIYDSRVNDSGLSVCTVGSYIEIADNETKTLSYDIDKIFEDYDENYVFANYVEGKNCWWWYYYLVDSAQNQKIIVEMTNEYNNGGEKHSYEELNPAKDNPVLKEDGYIKLDMSSYADALAPCDYVHIERKAEGESTWKTVMFYHAHQAGQLRSDVELTDYYTKKGTTYSYRMNAWNYSNNPIDLGTYTAENGLGEIKISNGKATYDEANHTIVFNELPTYEPEIRAGRLDSFEIRYTVNLENNQYGWIYCRIDDIKNNRFPLKKAYNVEEFLGKTMVPAYMWYQLYDNIDENCHICWRLEVIISEGDTSYPTINIPLNRDDFLN